MDFICSVIYILHLPIFLSVVHNNIAQQQLWVTKVWFPNCRPAFFSFIGNGGKVRASTLETLQNIQDDDFIVSLVLTLLLLICIFWTPICSQWIYLDPETQDNIDALTKRHRTTIQKTHYLHTVAQSMMHERYVL